MRGLNVVLDVRGTWCRGVSPFHAGIILQLDWICADRLMARTRRSAFILSLRTLVIGVDVEDVAMYRMLISLVHEPMSNQQFLQLRLKFLALVQLDVRTLDYDPTKLLNSQERWAPLCALNDSLHNLVLCSLRVNHKHIIRGIAELWVLVRKGMPNLS